MRTDLDNLLTQDFLKRFFAFVLIYALGALTTACVLKKPNQYEKENVILRPKSKLTAGGGGIDAMNLDHPVKISEALILNHLLSLRYQEMTLFGKKNPLYGPEEAEQLAPLISRGLGKVSARSILYHQLEGKHGRVAGDVFYTEGKIHWRFQTINGIDFSNQSMVRFAGRKGQSSFWKLAPRKGQGYYQSKKLGFGTTWENWIVANLQLRKVKLKNRPSERTGVAKKNKSIAGSQKSELPTVSPELEEKLQALKSLRGKDLIDDAEYERKRKELLDEYL